MTAFIFWPKVREWKGILRTLEMLELQLHKMEVIKHKGFAWLSRLFLPHTCIPVTMAYFTLLQEWLSHW